MLKKLWAERPSRWQVSGCVWLWLTIAMLVLDQITKIWASTSLNYLEPVAVMPYLNWLYVHNTGAAFSFLADAGGWQRWGFAVFAMGVTAGLLFMLRCQALALTRINVAYALIISGAIGNMIDRLLYGYVIDFIDFYVDTWHWPAFNVADIAICIGAGLMILDSLLEPNSKDKEEEAK